MYSPPGSINQRCVHLHVHSQFSLLAGTASVDALVARAAASGMTHLALTDNSALYGAVRFASACRNEHILPILGMAVQVPAPEQVNAVIHTDSGMLVLLATGAEGYRSLCQLSSYLQGRSQRGPSATFSLDWETLRRHREGLICISGGRKGWLERLIKSEQRGAATRFLSQLAGVFDENTYVALELHRPDDEVIASEIIDISSRFGVRTVAVHPVYCLSADEREVLHLLAAINRNCRLEEVPSVDLPDEGDGGVDLHWLDSAQMAGRYAAYPDALAESQRIAQRCEPSLPDGRPLWPVLDLPKGQSVDEALADLADRGLRTHYGEHPQSFVRERLRRELDAIAVHGYASLFLLVADIVRYARAHKIPVSTRGSVANSLVAFCTGITSVDPVEHDLLFERFLNPAREDPPDIDLDFCSRRRDEVLDYVRHVHGEDKVALVATVSTMRPKSAVRETGKALGLSKEEISALVKQLPRGWHPDPRRRSTKTLDDMLDELEDERMRDVVRRASALVGQPHHLSVHPGGIVISPGAMTDFAPVQWAPKGFLITQYDHVDVEAIGLLKIDLLGIRALTVLNDSANLVRRFHDPDFHLDVIPLQDEATGALISRAETVGVFQCESTGAQRTLRKLKAHTITDLAIANAFFKPGPALGGMARNFVRRYRGEEPVRFLHPALEPILGRTKGVLIFQEQILRLATEIAGLSWDQANQLRRGMSKFRPKDIEDLQAQFITGCQRIPPEGPGMSERQAHILWEQVVPFSGYGFNQGHATAYADVSYRSAYLKTHYPAAFLCARLAGWGGFHHPAIYMAEARRLGINVRPPHVNYSDRRFTLAWEPGPDETSQPVLYMGLDQIRDLRRGSIDAIVSERRRQAFFEVRDLLGRVDLQAKEITHLIQCGALDGLGDNRSQMLVEAGSFGSAGSALQLAFDFEDLKVAAEKPKDRLDWEQQILGQSISIHPLDLISTEGAGLVPLTELMKYPDKRLTVAGIRLPGWTGGKGYFLGDQQVYIVAIDDSGSASPALWKPVAITGRWRQDEWGMAWLQVEKVEAL